MHKNGNEQNSVEVPQELRAIFDKLVKKESSITKQSDGGLGQYKSSIGYNASLGSFKSFNVKFYTSDEVFLDFIEYCKKTYITWQELLVIFDKLVKKELPINEQTENSLEQYKSSIIYNINLYNFKSSNIPFSIKEGYFDNFFECCYNIFVTMPDDNHIREIRTGMIFPIVNLQKNYLNNDINIHYKIDSWDDYVQFAISDNGILRTNKIDLNQLSNYLNKEVDEIRNIIGCQQIIIRHTINNSKTLKKSKIISKK